MALLDVRNLWHHGAGEALSTPFPYRDIDTVGERVLHVSCVDLVHIGFAFQVRCHEIRISPIIIVLLIKIIPSYARYVLQVVQGWYLRHLGRKWRQHLASVVVCAAVRVPCIVGRVARATGSAAAKDALVHGLQLL